MTCQVIPFYFSNSINNLEQDHALVKFISRTWYLGEEIADQRGEINHDG
jgi:hypothetical protein